MRINNRPLGRIGILTQKTERKAVSLSGHPGSRLDFVMGHAVTSNGSYAMLCYAVLCYAMLALLTLGYTGRLSGGYLQSVLHIGHSLGAVHFSVVVIR